MSTQRDEIRSNPCHILYQVASNILNSAPQSTVPIPQTTPEPNEIEYSPFLQLFQKTPKFMDSVLQRLHEYVANIFQHEILVKSPKPRKPLLQPPQIDNFSCQRQWRLLTHLVFYFFQAREETVFFQLSKGVQKKITSLCIKFIKYACEKCVREVKAITKLLNASKKSTRAQQMKQLLKKRKRPRKERSHHREDTWRAKNEEDSDYIESESESEDRSDSDHSSSGRSLGSASESENDDQQSSTANLGIPKGFIPLLLLSSLQGHLISPLFSPRL